MYDNLPTYVQPVFVVGRLAVDSMILRFFLKRLIKKTYMRFKSKQKKNQSTWN